MYGSRIQHFIGANTGKLRPVSALFREGWSFFIIGGHACRRRSIHGRSPSPEWILENRGLCAVCIGSEEAVYHWWKHGGRILSPACIIQCKWLHFVIIIQVNIALSHGTSFTNFHHHLMFMLEKVTSKAGERHLSTFSLLNWHQTSSDTHW